MSETLVLSPTKNIPESLTYSLRFQKLCPKLGLYSQIYECGIALTILILAFVVKDFRVLLALVIRPFFKLFMIDFYGFEGSEPSASITGHPDVLFDMVKKYYKRPEFSSEMTEEYMELRKAINIKELELFLTKDRITAQKQFKIKPKSSILESIINIPVIEILKNYISIFLKTLKHCQSEEKSLKDSGL